MNQFQYIVYIPLLPLLSFLLLGLFGKKLPGRISGFIGTLVLLAVTLLSVCVAYEYFFLDGKQDGVYKLLVPFKFTWLSFSPGLSIDMGITLDGISAMMLVVVSLVSLMVHLFSLDYMKGEPRFSVYYAFLSLFTFSMLGLVVATNIFQIYIFWELVGISSYLLIGFYYEKPSAVAAAKKAFIVTRFADLGFLVGILMLAFYAGSLDFETIMQTLRNGNSPQSLAITSASFLGFSALTWALVLVYAGGGGKSAMFPLHIWLPDAMEGPTPVSALIHAATMVVAGVYLVARLFPIFSFNNAALEVVTFIGTISALLAAIIACTQTDIKRVLAYSTMSQIGYMMLALGVSRYGGEHGLGYTASMFHLFTHAFFKSLLFLCAGAVIHFVHSNEMKDMGRLAKLMPLTHLCFLVACLSIAGVPPFSGFFSKEEILSAAYRHNKLVYGIGVFTAGLTAFYMFRLYFSVFWNKTNKEYHHHAHTGPMMKIALVCLALFSIVSGFVPFSKYISSDGVPFQVEAEWMQSLLPIAVAVLGILAAYILYFKESSRPEIIARNFGAIYRTAYRKFYIDELYLFVTKKIIFNGIGRPAAWIDRNIVDGTMNAIAKLTARLSNLIKGFQSGQLQAYVMYFFAGVAGLTLLIIYLWK